MDWQALGRQEPPPSRPSEKELDEAEGGTQILPGNEEECGTITLKTQGINPENFPSGHVAFLMDVLTHPQMLELQRLLLGTSKVVAEYSSVLNRKGGYQGTPFHSHAMNSRNWDHMGTLDSVPVSSIEEYDTQPNYIVNLVCE